MATTHVSKCLHLSVALAAEVAADVNSLEVRALPVRRAG